MPKTAKQSTSAKKTRRKTALERDLEEGLEESFPASDAVAAVEPAPKDRGPRKRRH